MIAYPKSLPQGVYQATVYSRKPLMTPSLSLQSVSPHTLNKVPSFSGQGRAHALIYPLKGIDQLSLCVSHFGFLSVEIPKVYLGNKRKKSVSRNGGSECPCPEPPCTLHLSLHFKQRLQFCRCQTAFP